MIIKIYKNTKGKKQVLESYIDLLKQWNVELQEVDLKTKYGNTHCIISGEIHNPPLFFFHGVGDNSAVMWIKNIQELSQYFYCIAVDTIGGPGKSLPNENYTKEEFDQVDWISEIIEHFNFSIINMVGVSNGAYMAYNFATKNKEKINKVVCLEGGMIINNPLKSMIQTLALLFPQILLPTRKNIIAIMNKLTSSESNFYNDCPEVVDHMVLVMKNHNRRAMFFHKLEKYNKEEGVAVNDKLLFLIGDYRIDHKEGFINILDEGKFNYKVIKGAGHAINHEKPNKVNKEIIKFILKS